MMRRLRGGGVNKKKNRSKREVQTDKPECNSTTATQECDEEKVIQLFQE